MTTTATEYKLHPAANLFEPMTPEEYAGFKADIAENGQRVKIVLWQGQLIDGRHRLQACNELGREPLFEELAEDADPWAYVISSNLHRRHLTTSQRAMIANKLAKLKHGSNQHKEDAHKCASSQTEAAKALGVSRRSVQKARAVTERGSEAVASAVTRGELPLTKAAEFVASVPDKQQQAAVVAGGKKAVDAALKKPSAKPKPAPKETGDYCRDLMAAAYARVKPDSFLREAFDNATAVAKPGYGTDTDVHFFYELILKRLCRAHEKQVDELQRRIAALEKKVAGG